MMIKVVLWPLREKMFVNFLVRCDNDNIAVREFVIISTREEERGRQYRQKGDYEGSCPIQEN